VYTVFAIEKPSIVRDPWTRIDGKVTYGIYSIYSYIRVPHIYGLSHPYSEVILVQMYVGLRMMGEW